MSETAVVDPQRPGAARRWTAGLRQRFFPAEFRIDPPSWPHELETTLQRIAALQDAARADEKARADRAAAGTDGETPPAPPPEPPTLDDDALVDAAMGVWRSQRRLDTAGDDGGALARQLRRHLTMAWDGLSALELTTQTHDREPFDAGMAVEVLAIEPHADLTRETIIETVQPSIYRSGRQIRMAQVIVGRPERPSDS